MTKGELIEALKPFSNELIIDVAMGPYCSRVWQGLYELVGSEGHFVLCADATATQLVKNRMNNPTKLNRALTTRST